MSGISRDLWLSTLAELERPEDDPTALTAPEFATKFRIAYSTARLKLQGLVDAGRVTRVSKMIKCSDGRMKRVPAYKLVTDK